jgi:hypothetical protein
VEWVFDSQNVSFWSEAEGRYVLYYRRVVDGVRSVARTTSSDFVHWAEPVQMSFHEHPPTVREQLYTNQTAPYFRAPHIYLATAARFMQGRSALSDEQAAALGGEDLWRKEDCSDVVLMSARGGGGGGGEGGEGGEGGGGTEYARTFAESLVRPGIGAWNWTSRTNYPALGVVPTGDSEMSMYVQRRYGDAGHLLERLTLRIDGFVSVNAPYDGGELLTKPLRFDGGKLEINYSTGAAGGIRVEVQGEDGRPVTGFSADDCPEIVGDEIAHLVRWKGGNDLSKLRDQPVRLRFVMKDADLYSLRFVP